MAKLRFAPYSYLMEGGGSESGQRQRKSVRAGRKSENSDVVFVITNKSQFLYNRQREI